MKDEKLFRLTFSRNLLEHMNTVAGGAYEIKRFKLMRGKMLEPGQQSGTGLYAIISAKKGKVLRVAMNKAQADLLCDFRSRQLQEVSLMPTV